MNPNARTTASCEVIIPRELIVKLGDTGYNAQFYTLADSVVGRAVIDTELEADMANFVALRTRRRAVTTALRNCLSKAVEKGAAQAKAATLIDNAKYAIYHTIAITCDDKELKVDWRMEIAAPSNT